MNTQPEVAEDDEQTELNRLLEEALDPVAPPLDRRRHLKSRLLARAAESVAEQGGLLTIRAKSGAWRRIAKGIRVKPLWRGPAGNSVLIELAAGASLPVHRHRWTEEGIVLRGRLQEGDLDLGPVDYQVSPPGSRHGRIRSREGALAYLRGTALGHGPSVFWELLGGLPPVGGVQARIERAGAKGWEPMAPGAWRKPLWTDGKLASYFCRLDAGTRLEGHPHPEDEECMMLEGDLFLGDQLLRAGDFHLAPAGSLHGPVFTDVGALLFVRGAADDGKPPAAQATPPSKSCQPSGKVLQ